MTLVDYSSSGSGSDDDHPPPPPPPPTIVKKATATATATANAAIGKTSRKRKLHSESGEDNDSVSNTLPPLPSTFHSLYAINVRTSTSDDSALHGGRKRQTPHVEGKWPTHVYLEWYPSRSELKLLESVIAKPKDTSSLGHIQQHDADHIATGMTVTSLLQSNLGAQLPLHVSLSAPAVLETEQKVAFADAIQTAMQASEVRPFTVHVTGLDWVSNFEQSRWFLVLRLSKPEENGLNTLLKACNQCMREIAQPTLYDDQFGSGTIDQKPVMLRQARRSLSRCGARTSGLGGMPDRSSSFHISLAWTLEEPSKSRRAESLSLEEQGQLTELKSLKIGFNCVKLKMGSVVKDMLLSTHASRDKGIEGT